MATPLSARAATTYGANEGLTNLGVQTVARDGEGYIWVGSDDGLQRFDGHRFMRVDLPGAAADNLIRQLHAVPGALYIVTSSRLLRFDLKTQTFIDIPVIDRNGKAPEFSAVVAFPDGQMYASSYSGQLFTWRDVGGVAVSYTTTQTQALPRQTPKPQPVAFTTEPLDAAITNITDLYAGASGLLISTSKGLYLLNQNSTVAKAIRFDISALNKGAVAAFSAHEYPAGVLWIGYWNDALVRFDLKTNAVRWFHPKQPGAGALRSTSIHSFASRPDRLYIGTNRGIVVYHPSCECLRGLNQPAWNQIGGAGLVVTKLQIENDGLWASVWGDGLTRFSTNDELFQHQVKVDGNASSLAHPFVYALHANREKLWLGTYGGGVQSSIISQQRDGEDWNFQTLPWDKYPIESKFVWSIAAVAKAASSSTPAPVSPLSTQQSNINIGTGIGFYNWRGDGTNGQLSELKIAETNLTLHSIRTQYTSIAGRRYVGSTQGLFRIEGDTLVKVPFAESAPNKRLSQIIWSIAEHEGEIWLGTSRGLIRLTSDERFIALHEPGLLPSQLPGALVLVQKRDALGNWWIGTSGGLVQVKGSAAGPTFERHDNIAKLGVHRITSIEFDNAQQLWMGSPSGLVRYHRNTQQAELFDKRDGLVSDQLNFNSSASDGRLMYFGGLGGLVAFDPVALSPRASTPRTINPRVARVRVGQGAWQSNTNTLSLARHHDPVQVELTALYFSRPKNIRYAYRWSDGDDAFTELGDAQSVVLGRLPHGTHTLEIRATATLKTATSASAGANTQETIAEVLTVHVAHAWYESIFGRILLLAGLVSTLYGWTRWRTWRADSYAKQLKADVAERTAQLNIASAELAQSNTRLLQQARFDPLTGLANRRYLFELEHEHMQLRTLENTKEHGGVSVKLHPANHMDGGSSNEVPSLSVIMLDLDHFKKINDQYGHASGDAVLRDFAEVLRETVGDDGIAARYGGEEFLVLLFNVSQTRLLDLATRLTAAARNRKVHGQGRRAEIGISGISYTVSIGVASEFADTIDRAITDHPIERLIARADSALYEAKRAGRDRVVVAGEAKG